MDSTDHLFRAMSSGSSGLVHVTPWDSPSPGSGFNQVVANLARMQRRFGSSVVLHFIMEDLVFRT